MTEDNYAASYCVGMSIAGSLMQQNLEGLSPEVLAEAIKDAFQGKEMKYTPEEANAIIQNYVQAASEQKFKKNKEEGEAFLQENKGREGVQITPSGLQYEILEEGSGESPEAQSTVSVHYHGTTIDGNVFDSSVERNQPATFGVSQVIPGWTEALQLMKVGSKYRLFIPQELAYGANPHPGGPIQPYSVLIFDVELISIV